MSNITHQLPLTGLNHRQPSQQGFQAASYINEQAVRYRENQSTDLVLETKEGDKVTLSANNFSHLDAYTYDSMGVVRTESGEAAYAMSLSEITLASGKSFTFSVEGELSEEELADIGSLLKGLDGVITEMVQGDMDEAFSKAMELGTYDSVSSYEANLSYEMSYERMSATAAAVTQSVPAFDETAPEQSSLSGQVEEPAVTNGKGHKYGHYEGFDKFFAKLLDKLEQHGDKEVGLARNPINNLFQHHLDEIGDDVDSLTGDIYSTLEKAMNDIDTLIRDRMAELTGEDTEEVVAEEPVAEEE